MVNRNYQKELDRLIEGIDKDNPKTLLLHSCCAPCSSYVLKYLSEYFKITLLYFNPNISPKEEYENNIVRSYWTILVGMEEISLFYPDKVQFFVET